MAYKFTALAIAAAGAGPKGTKAALAESIGMSQQQLSPHLGGEPFGEKVHARVQRSDAPALLGVRVVAVPADFDGDESLLEEFAHCAIIRDHWLGRAAVGDDRTGEQLTYERFRKKHGGRGAAWLALQEDAKRGHASAAHWKMALAEKKNGGAR